jgi:tRNA A37 threonylcarbamoyladenosine modification protein TsaB
MILSIFIHSKELHVASREFANVYTVSESRELADMVVPFLGKFLSNHKNHEIKSVIYSIGPGSFTTVRIINSIVRGLRVTVPSCNFVGISNFLTYLSVFSLRSTHGIIAIPTMRGDYFTTEYLDCILQSQQILNIENINLYTGDKYYVDNYDFKEINLAQNQEQVLSSGLEKKNTTYIKRLLSVDYGFTPQYNH